MPFYIPSITLPPVFFTNRAVCLLLPLAIGPAVSLLVKSSQTKKTYDGIRQPPFRPPAWVFGPMWTILYASMGYAAHRATRIGLASPNPEIRALALAGQTLYTTQLVLNFAFMPLFFGYRRPVLALIDIVSLVGNVGALAAVWAKYDSTSAWLLAPYLAWISFASYITAGVGVLNNWDISDKALEAKKKE